MRVDRKQGLEEIVHQLREEWDNLVDEAKQDLGYSENELDFIVYRYAMLLFSLKSAVPKSHSDIENLKSCVNIIRRILPSFFLFKITFLKSKIYSL